MKVDDAVEGSTLFVSVKKLQRYTLALGQISGCGREHDTRLGFRKEHTSSEAR